MKINLFLILILLFIFFASCSEDSVNNLVDAPAKRDVALIISVENAGGDYSSLEYMYSFYRDTAETIFADIFQIDKSEFEGKSVNEIVETIGEDWQIESIKEIAGDYYKEIVILTDETNTKENLVRELKRLNKDYNIDMVFCMHGSENIIVFEQENYPLDKLTNELAENNVEIRMIYQTNCYSKYSFDNWAKTNIKALNGAEEVNRLTLFSPQYFLQYWIEGKNFTDCVELAYTAEVEKYRSYKGILPVIELALTEQFLAGSKQYIGGTNPMITKDH